MQDPMLSLPEVRLYRGCGMDFATPVGGNAGGERVSSLAVCVLAGGWGLGREQCVGETQESCSTTVAGIFKRPSPALGDMSVSNKHGASPILSPTQPQATASGGPHKRRMGQGTVLSLWALLSQIKYNADETHMGNAPWTASRLRS